MSSLHEGFSELFNAIEYGENLAEKPRKDERRVVIKQEIWEAMIALQSTERDTGQRHATCGESRSRLGVSRKFRFWSASWVIEKMEAESADRRRSPNLRPLPQLFHPTASPGTPTAGFFTCRLANCSSSVKTTVVKKSL